MKWEETENTFKEIVCSECESEYEVKVHWTDEDCPCFCPFCGTELESDCEGLFE